MHSHRLFSLSLSLSRSRSLSLSPSLSLCTRMYIQLHTTVLQYNTRQDKTIHTCTYILALALDQVRRVLGESDTMSCTYIFLHTVTYIHAYLHTNIHTYRMHLRHSVPHSPSAWVLCSCKGLEVDMRIAMWKCHQT